MNAVDARARLLLKIERAAFVVWVSIVAAVASKVAAYLLTYLVARAALSGALTMYVLRRWPAPVVP